MLGEIIIQMLLATFLGGLIGLERERKRKQAGLQTYSLVSLGACLFAIISVLIFNNMLSKSENLDLMRIVQSIAIGVGFLGAGLILKKENQIEGLTTAAGLWATAGIGLATGLKFYNLAIISALFVLFVLFIFGEIERKFIK